MIKFNENKEFIVPYLVVITFSSIFVIFLGIFLLAISNGALKNVVIMLYIAIIAIGGSMLIFCAGYTLIKEYKR